MLEQIMKHCRNYFNVEDGFHEGEFVIDNSTITLPFMLEGQYFKIEGSKLNDGVYQYPPYDLHNETFTGCIEELAVPKAFLDLVDEISVWTAKNKNALDSVYTSEAFGGYSRTKATGSDGNAVTWQSQFRGRLNDWRKI